MKNELYEMVKIVIKAIERTGDFALYSKTENEQKIMRFLQENYSELYLSLIGNMVVGSSTGGFVKVEPNKNGGVDLTVQNPNITKQSFLPNFQPELEKDKNDEMER